MTGRRPDTVFYMGHSLSAALRRAEIDDEVDTLGLAGFRSFDELFRDYWER